MAVTLYRGQDPLTKDNLNIYVYREYTDPVEYIDPFRITYTIYKVISDRFYNQECGEEELRETVESIPLPFGKGKYFAPWVMPNDIELGRYRIKWNIKLYPDSGYFTEEEEFDIVAPGSICTDESGNSTGTGPFPHNEYDGGCWEG